MFAIVPGQVNVTLRAGTTLKATLVCVGADTLVMTDGARTRHVPLVDVLRIVKPRDSIANGFLIGAGVGLVLAAGTYGGEASYGSRSESSYVLEGALTLGAIGAVIDALHGSSWTVYSAPPSPMAHATIRWRVRF